MTLAMAGKRVLLIDLDLRRHALSSQLGHSNSKTGITSYLAGTVSDVESMIQNSGFHQNLDVIYAGVQPPNPAEMLLSDKLDKLIAEMRGRYDYVFLDSTPAMSVADAIITDRLADLCIYPRPPSRIWIRVWLRLRLWIRIWLRRRLQGSKLPQTHQALLPVAGT